MKYTGLIDKSSKIVVNSSWTLYSLNIGWFPIFKWILVKLQFHKNLVIYSGYIPVSTLLFGTLFDREKESKKCSKKIEKKFAPFLFWNTFLVGDKLFLSRSHQMTHFSGR